MSAKLPHRSLLVTGGAGFIGSNFVRWWRRRRPADRVVVLDALRYSGTRESLQSLARGAEFQFCLGDICDFELVRELFTTHSIDTVVHFAAESHVDRSIESPDVFLRTNVLGTHALLKAAREAWSRLTNPARRPRFHHVSTDEVFGTLSDEEAGFSETTAYAPNSPYAASKAASDHLVRSYYRTFGLPVTTSNCSNNFGPYQHPEKLVPSMIVRALMGQRLPVYGDGLHRREWLFVEDHCQAVELVLDGGSEGETYNIGGGHETANIDLVRELCRRIDERFHRDLSLKERFPNSPPAASESCFSLISSVTDRLGHDRRYAIDGRKAARELGYSASYSFSAALDATVDWYLTNEHWWRPLVAGS